MDKKIGFSVSRKTAVKIVSAMYLDEPCRICGEIITDLAGVVWAGYSKDSKARSAHGTCWKKNIPESQWAHP